MEGVIIPPIEAVVQDASARPRFAPLRQGIAMRLLALILLFSSAVTLISTAVQLYLDYRRDLGAIETRFAQIQASNLGSLASSLWHVDVDQLRLQLEGMLRLPDMQALEVRENYTGELNPLTVSVGQRHDRAVVTREYPIVHDDRGTPHVIGVLYVEATLEDVYRRLIDTGVIILVSQGVKTFLVSLFTLYIVWRLVTRHLVELARFLGQYDIRRPTPALRLNRRSFGGQDELDRVVAAFNGMCISLERAYVDLRDAYAELEQDIIARRQAEAEVIHLNAVLEQRVRQRTAELEAANKELA
ncbi:MAG: hypothetical protein K2X44_05865, partial [Magnetospirillum sp.]|nr:hypothetical protein [Magnetospirillum sp.]